MSLIKEKCLQELPSKSVIITCRFPLPNLKADQIIGKGIDTVWKYDVLKIN